jgi:hypothetical protein
MKMRAGLWIDHRKAFIVCMTDTGQVTHLVISMIDKQLGRLSGIRSTTPYEPLQVPADDSRERKLTTALNGYYRAVIAGVRDAQSIQIFGPGEAKGELMKRLQREKLGARVVGMETVDRMTDRQIVAKVHAFFGKPDARANAHRGRTVKASARGAVRRAALTS